MKPRLIKEYQIDPYKAIPEILKQAEVILVDLEGEGFLIQEVSIGIEGVLRVEGYQA